MSAIYQLKTKNKPVLIANDVRNCFSKYSKTGESVVTLLRISNIYISLRNAHSSLYRILSITV